jgi:short-subunit dehydrogenase
MQLAGAVAIVTGASSGIGRATVAELRRRGAEVVAVARTETALAAVADETGATPVVADVRDPEHAHHVVRATTERHGRVDLVIANAGIGHAGAFVDMPPERIDELIAVNVRGPMLLARAAAPAMAAGGGGALVLVSSIAGALHVPRETVYSATKAALEGFAEPLREELRAVDVSVMTVLPGVVTTPFFDRRGTPYERGFPRPIPAERVATALVRGVERGATRVIVPRWMALPVWLRGAAPGVYRTLARRFG